MRVLLTLRFNLPKPKSYPKRVVHHLKKPDIDNYAKALIDGLVKGRIIEDDGLVTDLTIQKRYLEPGHPEGVEVDLTALPAEVP
jgi:Holliday junction resolvase RusA-like endonuclease